MGGRFSVVWLLGCRIAAVKDLAVVLGSRFAFRGLALAKDFAVVWLPGHRFAVVLGRRFAFCRLALVKDFAVVWLPGQRFAVVLGRRLAFVLGV